ncbi:hypothetical protein BDB00DRAFT_68786 [Zychaea mexicana]|uniref:uncharacterized protein n=1 Tax=Zychaea mexicana TaxID=64656 RepID=UPI0022FE3069|nr:uncharacterized protein BDB00DRAFT_68786 [Zychaea mexicana]KAI9488061.1 hypothetical protein BDB00DRAFT_68786 [Zychaea mexicana]
MDSDERMNEMLSKSAQKTRELLEAMERSLKTEQTYATRRQQLVDERRHSSITTTNNNTRAAPPPLVAVPQQPRNQQQRTRMISASEEKVQQKRQSLDMEGMLALRRDSDAIIERRLSLLKVRANKLLQTDEHQQQLNDNDKRRRRWSFTPIEENPSSPPPTTTTTSHRPQDSVDNMDTSNKPIVDRMPVFQSVRARTLSMRETRHEKTSRPYHEETTTAPILSSSSSNSEATTISPYFSATATGSDALSHGNNKQYYHHNHHVEEKGEEKKMEVENQTERVSYMRRADLCKNTNNNDNHSSSVKEMSNKQQPSAQYRQSISSRRHTLSSSAANSTMNTELMSDDRNKRRLRRLSPTRNTSSTSSGNYGNGQQQPQHTMTAEKLRKRHSTIITAGDLDLPPSPTTATGKSVTETAKELLNSIRQRRQSTAEHHHHPSSTSTTTTRATRTTYHQYHPQHEEQRQQEAEARQARLRMRRNTVVANGLDYHDKVDNDIVDEDRITRRMHRLSIAADDHYTKKQPSSSTRSKYLYNEETNGNIRSSSYKHYLA